MGTLILKPLGAVLYQADLIPLTVVEEALKFQSKYGDRRLGDILSIWGKLSSVTIKFFAEEWPRLFHKDPNDLLGQYFKAADLLVEGQIQEILSEQKGSSDRFGMIAVRKGWLKQNTVDFFLRHLTLEHQWREILYRDGSLDIDSILLKRSRDSWAQPLSPSVISQPDTLSAIPEIWTPPSTQSQSSRSWDNSLASLVGQRPGVQPPQTDAGDNQNGSIQLLMEGVLVWNAWRKANLNQVPDLSKCDLKGANLRGFDLSVTDLSSANLRGADLRGAILCEAYPLGADLREANLSEADLSNCYLCEANLSGANLSGANLSGANLLSANLCGANFHNANLSGAILTRTKALATNFAKANLSGANLDDWQIDRETFLDSRV
jgi:Pentapeptide repeats (8 copies)